MKPPIRVPPTVLAAAIVACLAATPAGAQPPPAPTQVYKIVGPDGRITYSDRPPADTAARASLINRPAASGAVVLPPPITAITPWMQLSGDARRGIVPAVPLGQTAASPGVVNVALADSLSMVLARAEAVDTMRSVCVRTAPSASSAYNEAARHWEERNGAVVAQADKVLLGAFLGPQRNKLQATAHTRLQGILTPLASASIDAKVQWCETAADAVSHGALDLQGAQGVAAPVMSFLLPE
jgi:hypothetical protein